LVFDRFAKLFRVHDDRLVTPPGCGKLCAARDDRAQRSLSDRLGQKARNAKTMRSRQVSRDLEDAIIHTANQSHGALKSDLRQVAHDLDSVEAGHMQIAKYQVERSPTQGIDSGAAVCDALDVLDSRLVPQHAVQHETDRGIVVDDEHAHFIWCPQVVGLPGGAVCIA